MNIYIDQDHFLHEILGFSYKSVNKYINKQMNK